MAASDKFCSSAGRPASLASCPAMAIQSGAIMPDCDAVREVKEMFPKPDTILSRTHLLSPEGKRPLRL